MRLLLVGGSGHVGRLVLPYLSRSYKVRVLDLRPPGAGDWDYVEGSATDSDALRSAVADTDAMIYLAKAVRGHGSPNHVANSFDVNVKGVHLALEACALAGITHAVHVSTMSVYGGMSNASNLTSRYFADEELVPDESNVYGFTKHIGEEVCRNATRSWHMSVNVLRLCLPMSDSEWLSHARPEVPSVATSASDVASALAKAVEYCGCGFQVFNVSGDYRQECINMDKASRLLGWRPLSRPQ